MTTLIDFSLRSDPPMDISATQLIQYALAFLPRPGPEVGPQYTMVDTVNIKIARSCLSDALVRLGEQAERRGVK